jgi:hypothetical protein
MVLQGEAAEDEKDEAAPLRVVGVLEVQNNRNEIPDVLDGGGLTVEAGNVRGVGVEGVVVVVLKVVVEGVAVACIGRAVLVSESRGLQFQGVRRGMLLFESVGGGADALLGSGDGFEECSVLLELLAALSIGGAQGGGFFFQSLGGGEGLIAELGRGGRSRSAGAGGAIAGGSHGRSGGKTRSPGDGGGRGAAVERPARGPSGRARAPRGRKRKRERGRGPGLN